VLEVGEFAQRARNGVNVVANQTSNWLPLTGEMSGEKFVNCWATFVFVYTCRGTIAHGHNADARHRRNCTV
jgi:hypothetical protein